MSGSATAGASMKRTNGTNGPLLEVVGVSKHFGGVAALADASFAISHNECVALMGSNGAGKSTMVRILSGVHSPDSGTVLVEGSPVRFNSPADARRAGVETVFQSLALCENLDAAGNLFLGRELYRRLGPLRLLRRRAMLEETRRVLSAYEVKIRDLRVPAISLSGGQRQALAFARSARGARKLLILDEPTAALGVAERGRVQASINQMRVEQQLSVLLITHNLAEMRKLADRVVVVRQGRIVGDRRADEIEDEEIVMMIVGGSEKAEPGRRG